MYLSSLFSRIFNKNRSPQERERESAKPRLEGQLLELEPRQHRRIRALCQQLLRTAHQAWQLRPVMPERGGGRGSNAEAPHVTSSYLLLVGRPGAPNVASLLLVAMPGAPSSF